MTNQTRPLLFDSHAHLVADDKVAYPRNPMIRPASAPPRLPGVIGTPGGHHGPNPINEVPDALRMLDWMKEENVDGGVAVQKRMVYRYDNSYILDSSDKYPEIFSAVVILDAEDEGTPDLCVPTSRTTASPACGSSARARKTAACPGWTRRRP